MNNGKKMAKLTDVSIDKNSDELKTTLIRAFQSGNINFLIGSGASMPAIKVAGAIETEIQDCFESGSELDAYKLIYKFLSSMRASNDALISDKPLLLQTGESDSDLQIRQTNLDSTKSNYKKFIEALQEILNRRKVNLLPKQANIFTTNYDLFFEQCSEDFHTLKFNDGFSRNLNLKGVSYFSSTNFFNTTFNNGNNYNYKVEIPTINLIKIHGSLSWKKKSNQIVFFPTQFKEIVNEDDLVELKSYSEKFSLILPQKGKFRETILDRIYYDLLRLYANELDKENTFLIVFGFSFADEHIYDITKRALKNPTLKILIFAYNQTAAGEFTKKFDGYTNVEVIFNDIDSVIDFGTFNSFLNIFEHSEA